MKKRRKQKRNKEEAAGEAIIEEEESLEGERWEGELDMIQWTDIEFDTLKMNDCFDRQQIIRSANIEEQRADLEAREGETNRHAEFLTTFKLSTYTENITTLSKHADAIWGTVGFNTSSQSEGTTELSSLSSDHSLNATSDLNGNLSSPLKSAQDLRASGSERRFLPKVEAGASHTFMDQQEKLIQRQHDERSLLREKLMKIRNDAYTTGINTELASLSRTSTGYKLDSNQLSSLAKEIISGQGKVSTDKNFDLPSLGAEDSMRANSSKSTAFRSSRRPDHAAGPRTQGPKLRFLS